MTLVPNETEQALNRQHDVYAAAREEYRKKIEELAAEVERLRAALEELADCDFHEGNCASLEIASRRIRNIARAALEERT